MLNFHSDRKAKIRQQGVVPFNKFETLKYPNHRLVNLLDYEDILYNSTLHFDFNLPTKLFTSVESAPKSKIYFNGIEKRVIQYS